MNGIKEEINNKKIIFNSNTKIYNKGNNYLDTAKNGIKEKEPLNSESNKSNKSNKDEHKKQYPEDSKR